MEGLEAKRRTCYQGASTSIKLEVETGPRPYKASYAAEPNDLERVTGLGRVIGLNYQGKTGLWLHNWGKGTLYGLPKGFLGAIVSEYNTCFPTVLMHRKLW